MPDDKLRPMLERMVEKVSKMKPIPPCDNLFDITWGKVDKLILKTMKVMKDKGGVERPLHPLSETLFDMSCEDVGANFPNTNQALQTVTYRAMDTRLLVDEFGRMRRFAIGINEAAKGKDVKFAQPNFPPSSPAMVPPCFVDRDVYNNSAVGIVNTFAHELRERGILPPLKQQE